MIGADVKELADRVGAAYGSASELGEKLGIDASEVRVQGFKAKRAMEKASEALNGALAICGLLDGDLERTPDGAVDLVRSYAANEGAVEQQFMPVIGDVADAAAEMAAAEGRMEDALREYYSDAGHADVGDADIQEALSAFAAVMRAAGDQIDGMSRTAPMFETLANGTDRLASDTESLYPGESADFLLIAETCREAAALLGSCEGDAMRAFADEMARTLADAV